MEHVLSSIVSVGIDISKKKFDVALLSTDHTCIAKQYENTAEGISQFIQFLQTQKVAKATPCVLESTGDYHLLCAVMVTNAKFLVNVINPLITKKYQLSSIRQAKSDRIDAKRLAEIGLKEPNLPVFSAKTDTISAHKLISLLAKLEKIYQQLHMSYNNFQLTQATLKLTAIDLSAIDTALKSLKQAIDTIKKYLVSLAPAQSTTLAATLPGVSSEKLSILTLALTDKHFSNRDQLIAFVGLDVRARQSGQWQGKQKLSKRGNPFLRKILYQIAWGLKTHHPDYKQYYHRLYLEEGKHYTTTLIAIARKFLRFLFAQFWKNAIFPQLNI